MLDADNTGHLPLAVAVVYRYGHLVVAEKGVVPAIADHCDDSVFLLARANIKDC